MTKKFPDILYKYRQLDERTKHMLANNEVYFSLPTIFNDPFDCIAQEYMLDDFREDLTKLREEANRGLLSSQDSQDLENIINNDSIIIEARKEVESALQDLRNSLGVLSLSSRNDSILMWSHYADSHRGFCMGFKFRCKENFISEVSYSTTRNKSFPLQCITNQLNDEEFGEGFKNEYLLKKHKDWKYEKEWRMFAPPGVATYSDKDIDRIIFGLRMPSEDRKSIMDIVQDKDINFYEAIKGTEGFICRNKRTFMIEIYLISTKYGIFSFSTDDTIYKLN